MLLGCLRWDIRKKLPDRSGATAGSPTWRPATGLPRKRQHQLKPRSVLDTPRFAIYLRMSVRSLFRSFAVSSISQFIVPRSYLIFVEISALGQMHHMRFLSQHWKHHSRVLVRENRLPSLRHELLGEDFVCEAVLAAASTVFAAMLGAEMKESHVVCSDIVETTLSTKARDRTPTSCHLQKCCFGEACKAQAREIVISDTDEEAAQLHCDTRPQRLLTS